MKKIIVFSALIAAILIQTTASYAGGPRGHKAYVKHSKHHKAHKMHRSHGIIDATYN